MTCYDDLFVTERYAREVVDGLRLVCKRERQASVITSRALLDAH